MGSGRAWWQLRAFAFLPGPYGNQHLGHDDPSGFTAGIGFIAYRRKSKSALMAA